MLQSLYALLVPPNAVGCCLDSFGCSHWPRLLEVRLQPLYVLSLPPHAKTPPPLRYQEFEAMIQKVSPLIEEECGKNSSSEANNDLGEPVVREYFDRLLHGSSDNSKRDEAINMPRRTTLVVRDTYAAIERGDRVFVTYGIIHARRQEASWRKHLS